MILRFTLLSMAAGAMTAALIAAGPATAPATSAAATRTAETAPALVFDPPMGTSKLLLIEDFESTAAGQIPKGFSKTGAVSVVEDTAHSGKKSLRIDPAARGARRITTQSDVLKELGGQFWGRLYFKVQLPVAAPTGAGNFPVIHSTIVAGSALSPQYKDAIEVRMLDTVLGPNGTHQFIYNVQPAKRPEFGKGGAYTHRYTDHWTLAEWSVDFATQSYHLYIDGKEVKDVAVNKGAGNFDKAEIPEVFQSLSFGWYNYQAADKGFTAWLDDIALSKERIGTRGLPAATEPASAK